MVAYFATGAVTHTGIADSAGLASIAFSVGSATPNRTVPVRVYVRSGLLDSSNGCATAFVPQPPAPPPPPPGKPAVSLGRIWYDAPGSDDGSNINQEYVTVRNTGTAAQAMTGWTLRDVAGHVFTFPSFTLAADGYVIVHSGQGTNSTTHLYWQSGAYIWNNDGDAAYLRSNSGTTVDTCSWPGGSPGYIDC